MYIAELHVCWLYSLQVDNMHANIASDFSCTISVHATKL